MKLGGGYEDGTACFKKKKKSLIPFFFNLEREFCRKIKICIFNSKISPLSFEKFSVLVSL